MLRGDRHGFARWLVVGVMREGAGIARSARLPIAVTDSPLQAERGRWVRRGRGG
ncbi:hypothetical protein [Microbacterium maritypicum]|uniref:Uncharacterized protein n=1 Tax=Microbacterium maritypicum TaxID=33918 RepID=A0ACD4B761_MICMQ|nr:hypothetical protein [Microbacterium liquefaciens]UTT53378.1 hypothetical protein NMQ05_02005 [Microbacterium liquefaciens]